MNFGVLLSEKPESNVCSDTVIMAVDVGEGSRRVWTAAASWRLAVLGLAELHVIIELELRANWPTDYMDGLNLSSFHFLSSVTYELGEGMERVECVCVRVCACCIHLCACWLLHHWNQWLSRRDIHPHWLFVSFQHALLCCCWFSHELLLTRWRAHVILNRCAMCRRNAVIPKPLTCSVFLTQPKNKCHCSAFWKLFAVNKTHNSTSLLLPSFPLSLLCFCPPSHCLGHHPLWI